MKYKLRLLNLMFVGDLSLSQNVNIFTFYLKNFSYLK